jgi:hypothetical protein
MSASHRMDDERARPLELRASDEDRDTVVSLLRSHAAEGRLDSAELEERTGAALSARTRGELAALVEDLPPTGPARSRPRPPAWRAQLPAFVAINALLIAIWALSGFGYFWPAWPLLGWGLALATQARCARGSGGRRARSSVEQALGVRPERLPRGEGGGKPALER